MALAASINQGRSLPKSTAYNRAFFMGVTGLTLTVTLSKAGAAFGAIDGTVSEISSGWYKAALTVNDTDTEGDLAYHATDGGTNIEDWSDQVAAPVRLADKVVHQGKQFNIINDANDASAAVTFSSTGNSAGPGLSVLSDHSGAANALSVDGPAGAKFNATQGVACQFSGGGPGIQIYSGGSTNPGLIIEGGDNSPAIHLQGAYTTPGPVVIIDATAADSGVDGGPAILMRVGATNANVIELTPGTGGNPVSCANPAWPAP